MVSTDGSRDDDEREDNSLVEPSSEEPLIGDSAFPTGPRRSTYTPPANPAASVPGMQPPVPSAAEPDAPEAPAVEPDEAPAAETTAKPFPFEFDFGKPRTAPVSVVYQLDDIEPELPFGIPVETLPAPPAGARISPRGPWETTESPESSADTAPPAPMGGSAPFDLPPPMTTDPGIPPYVNAPPPVYSIDPDPSFESQPPRVAAPEEPNPWEPSSWEPNSWEPPAAPSRFESAADGSAFAPPAYEIPSYEEPASERPTYDLDYDDRVNEDLLAGLPGPSVPSQADAYRIDPVDSFVVPPPVDEPAHVDDAPAPVDDAPVSELFTVEPTAVEQPDSLDVPDSEPTGSTEQPLTQAEQLARLSQEGAPSGPPWVPERKSLRDDELSSLLADSADQPGGIESVMEELQRQVQLRREESQEFQEWQESMLAVGTPEAITAVQQVLPGFTDIVSPATAAAAAAAAGTLPVDVEGVTEPETETASQAETETAESPIDSLSTLPPPPFVEPSFVEPEQVDSEQESEHSAPEADQAAAPETTYTGPSFEQLFSGAEVHAAEVTVDVADEPSDALEGFEVDGDRFDDLVFEQTVGEGASDFGEGSSQPEPAEEPVPAPEPEPEPEPEPMQESEPQQQPDPPYEPWSQQRPTTPPPLVEPPAFPASAGYPQPWAMPAPPVVPEIPSAEEPDAAVVPLAEPDSLGTDFTDPSYATATGTIEVLTGAFPVPPEDTDEDDPVDPIDQVGFEGLIGAVPAAPATAPVFVTRVPDDEVVLNDPELERPRVFSLEVAGLEPTPEEQRVGRASRMFWLWFAANASIASIAFGGILFSLGLSLRQAVVGILAGVAVSFLPLGLGTLAGKLSGQPTMVISRAAFGVHGNVVPAALALISRVFWGAAMLWILGQGVASILIGAGIGTSLGRDPLAYLSMAAGFLVAGVIAVFGYGFIARLQLIVSIASGILIIGLIALTAKNIDVSAALTHPDGSWMLAGTAAVLVFSFVGLLWANSSADLARYQRPGSAGASSMLWTTIGATVPTFLLISYGALLAASNERIAAGLLSNPFDTLGGLLPSWYPAPLIAALALGLISSVVVTIYSGGFALKAIGVNTSRVIAVVIVAVLVVAVAFLLTVAGTDYSTLFRDLATTLAVPVAAWAGIFAADTMIRNRALDSESLLKVGGIYPSVQWVNLPALLVISALGFGLTTATASWLGWQGFLFPLLGVPLDSALAGTDLGVFVALLLGLLVPIVSGVPGIRKQEATARRSV